VLLNSVYEYAQEDRKILVRVSIGFGIAFAVLTGVNYSVQLSTVRLTIAKGEIVGLEQWLQASPYSGVAAINMLGWTLFLGLSSPFVAPVFFWQRFGKGHLHCFLGERCFCLLGGIGHIFEITVLVFITINLGMGAAVMVPAIGLAILFRRLRGMNDVRPMDGR